MKNDDENGLEAATFEEEDKEEEDDDFQRKTLKAFHLFAVPNLESESRTNYKGKAGKKIGIVSPCAVVGPAAIATSFLPLV